MEEKNNKTEATAHWCLKKAMEATGRALHDTMEQRVQLMRMLPVGAHGKISHAMVSTDQLVSMLQALEFRQADLLTANMLIEKLLAALEQLRGTNDATTN